LLESRPEEAARLRANVEAADARTEAFIAERLPAFLSSRKVAEDLSDRRRVEEMECQVRELNAQIGAYRG
jgi:hypothetical protein